VIFILPFFGGMLAAIAIPAYQDYVRRAQMVEVIAASDSITKEVEEAWLAKRSWPTGRRPIDSRYAFEAEVSPQGTVVVTVTNEVVPKGGRIRFTPVEERGVIRWECTSDDVPPRYLPPRCR
jgi:type IV pilus assembly protein PilA